MKNPTIPKRTPGFVLDKVYDDPGLPAEGQIWYNSRLHALKMRDNTATRTFSDATIWAHDFATTGDGSLANPYAGWAANLPYGPHTSIHFGPYYYAVTAANEFGFTTDGYDGLKLRGDGTTIIYTGASNIATMCTFSGNVLVKGNEGCELSGFRFDGNGKVTGDMVVWQAMHSSLMSDIHFLNGTGTCTALAVIGCTLGTFISMVCTRFEHTGNVNPFLHALRTDMVVATGNYLSCPTFIGYEFSGTQGTGILIDGTFNGTFQGACDAVINTGTGWGVEIGTIRTCNSIHFEQQDTEVCGPIIAQTGGHQGVRIVLCDKTLFTNCHNFDSSLKIESTAGSVTCINCQFFGVIHDSSSGFVQIGCTGMDINNGQVFGTGYVRTNIAQVGTGLQLLPECVIGRGTNGLYIDNAMYGGFVLYARGNPTPTTKFAMYQSPAGDTQVGGNSLQFNSGGVSSIASATGSAWTFSVPITSSNLNYERSVTFDGGGAVITSGTKVRLRIPHAGIIQQVTMLADVSGSIAVDIKKVTYASYTGAGSGSTIVASAPPTITSAVKSQDATLTGWTKTVAANDILEFSITSATTIQQLEVSLAILRT